MMSQKTAVVVLAVPYPVCLFLFTMGLPVPVLYVMIFLIGITKGMITIINNHAIRQVTGSSNQYLNLLHDVVCGGGFPVPIRYDAPHGSGYELEDDPSPPCSPHGSHRSFLRHNGLQKVEKEVEKKAGEENGGSSMTKEKFWFLKNTGFLLAVWGIVLLYGP